MIGAAFGAEHEMARSAALRHRDLSRVDALAEAARGNDCRQPPDVLRFGRDGEDLSGPQPAGEGDSEEADIRADIANAGIGIDDSAEPLHPARLIGPLVEEIRAMKDPLADAERSSAWAARLRSRRRTSFCSMAGRRAL